MIALALLIASVAGASPEDCFTTTDLVNPRDLEKFPTVNDNSALDNLTPDHAIIEFNACFTDTKLVGFQLTHGVWPKPLEAVKESNGGGDSKNADAATTGDGGEANKEAAAGENTENKD